MHYFVRNLSKYMAISSTKVVRLRTDMKNFCQSVLQIIGNFHFVMHAFKSLLLTNTLLVNCMTCFFFFFFFFFDQYEVVLLVL